MHERKTAELNQIKLLQWEKFYYFFPVNLNRRYVCEGAHTASGDIDPRFIRHSNSLMKKQKKIMKKKHEINKYANVKGLALRAYKRTIHSDLCGFFANNARVARAE